MAPPHPHPLLARPILPTLLRLAAPNVLGMVATALVAVAETAYAGRLGTVELAGMALVFPFVMLQQMMSAGAMGGAISSAVSRALGAGDTARAAALALHAALIGLGAGLVFSAVFLLAGPAIFRLLGGRGAALAAADAYATVVFAGSAAIWVTNSLISVLRGTGDMRASAALLLAVSLLQVLLGGALAFGIGPLPPLGLAGIGLGQALAFVAGAAAVLAWFGRGRARVKLAWARPRRALFADILRVGLVSTLSPLVSVSVVLILTRLVAGFGTEALAGYGIGVRLEFLLIPIAFAIGIAAIPLVGTAIGAGDVARARRAAWISGALAFAALGAFGLLAAAIPRHVADAFTDDPAAIAVAARFFAWVGPAYGFFGLGLVLYFASQGAGRMTGPLAAAGTRLAVVALGGWWVAGRSADIGDLFAVIALALVAYGCVSVIGIAASRWTAQRARP
jgi:putative MATE family efflux protein